MKMIFAFLKENKALLILPLALLPFVVLIFYILGGGGNTGKEKPGNNGGVGKTTGLNYELPEADQTIEIVDKMEAYQQERSLLTDPHDYHIESAGVLNKTEEDVVTPGDSVEILDKLRDGEISAGVSGSLLAHIRKKERQIIEEQQEDWQGNSDQQGSVAVRETVVSNRHQPEVMRENGIGELERIFDQNTVLGRRNDSLLVCLKEANRQLQELSTQHASSFHLQKEEDPGFGEKLPVGELIKAEVYETTTVLDGNRVKLRLLENCRVNGRELAESSFLYGICRVEKERLFIHVSQIPVEGTFFPVALSIFDLDGIEGLYIPDNVARKVVKEVGGSTNTSSLFGVTADPLTYLGVQAADKTARSVFKSIRLKKVTIRQNTLVYLINQKEKL